MSSDTPQPKPQVSPDGFKYWDGSDWRQMPGKICEWDGFEWKVKPSGIESEWSGKQWIAKPLGVKSRWNGSEWAVIPAGESKWDGRHYVSKPDGEAEWNGTFYVPKPEGVDSRWDGKRWQVRPQGRAYWTGSRWRSGRRPIIKFGVPGLVIAIVLAAILGGLLWKSSQDKQAAVKAKEQAAGWTNSQTLAAATSFTESLNAWNASCYREGFSRAAARGEQNIGQDPVFKACLRNSWKRAVPRNTAKKVTFTVYTGEWTGWEPFTIKDTLGNTYSVCYDSNPYSQDRSKDYTLKMGGDCESASPLPSSD